MNVPVNHLLAPLEASVPRLSAAESPPARRKVTEWSSREVSHAVKDAAAVTNLSVDLGQSSLDRATVLSFVNSIERVFEGSIRSGGATRFRLGFVYQRVLA